MNKIIHFVVIACLSLSVATVGFAAEGVLPENLNRAFTITKKYLVVPIHNGAIKCNLELEVDGKTVRRYETELAADGDSVDWYAYFTIESYQGRPARIVVDRATDEGFALIRQSDIVPGSEAYYTEKLRPQFHFSQKVGWNNDPNGMVYLDGEWHLYFQHNPVGWTWGNMTWGHAVSKDLIHWEQLPDIFFPGITTKGDCFSGSAIIDTKNTAGWKTGSNEVLVAFLTDTKAGEIAGYSNDKGRSFDWHKGNPVVKHTRKGRDPKVTWYEYQPDDKPLNNQAKKLGGHWVMAVYEEPAENEKNIAFYTSVDLKAWTKQSHLSGYYECPELFELPVNGDANKTRWIVFAGDARYAIGDFDGQSFTPEHKGKQQLHYGPYFASQTFSDSPDGRRIQIGWAKIKMPNMPFNQTFSFPTELTLKTTDDGLRMFATPIKEIEKLHKKKHLKRVVALTADKLLELPVSGQLFDIRATFELGSAKKISLDIGGNIVSYNTAEEKLNGVPLKPLDGKISLQVLIDLPMIEICGNDGAVYITAARSRTDDIGTIKTYARGGAAKLISLEVYELKSIWTKQ